MEIIKVRGICRNGKINIFGINSSINLSELSLTEHPELPDECELELTISLNQDDFLSGKNGIVWATYYMRQAEIIHNTLLAQNINSEINNINTGKEKLFLLKVTNRPDINEAMDFIWKSDSGLNLKPDWTYSEGETNKSFEQWLSGQ
ncbi:MAG TPA: hypothetical protein VJ954_01285 [Ignavibacteriaceae bacterium]|nr:hypothetical protein [Ignavibacteriaceae bacterium]